MLHPRLYALPAVVVEQLVNGKAYKIKDLCRPCFKQVTREQIKGLDASPFAGIHAQSLLRWMAAGAPERPSLEEGLLFIKLEYPGERHLTERQGGVRDNGNRENGLEQRLDGGYQQALYAAQLHMKSDLGNRSGGR